MTDHAHEFPPQGVLPPAICPSIEVLVHRRATELIAERPRRRIAMASSVGGVAVAAVAAVLVLVLGSPSGGGLLSPRQAVAAVVQTLEGNGILHWVREERVSGTENPDPAAVPERTNTEEWLDLSDGDSHVIAKAYVRGESEPQVGVRWVESGIEWEQDGRPGADPPTIRRTAPVSTTAVDEIRETLIRADRGENEIASAGEHAGHPLVVVTERRSGIVRRVWITREDVPQLVRSETTVTTRTAAQPVVSSTATRTWQVLPRTAEALAEVEIPSNAKRVP